LKRDSTFAGRFALTGVAAAALCVAASSASALGLGRLQVQSALGEALRAEIDVTSMSPEEQSNLRLRVASPEAYRAAGVDYNSVLPGTQVELRRRPDGRPFLKITSDRGVQEPFIDVILEINWSSGRLVREYTMLFDPPTTARAAPPTPTTAAVAPAYSPAAPAAPTQPVSPPRAPRALPAVTPLAAVAPRLAERRQAPAKPIAEPPVAREPRPPRAAAAGADQYRVKAGDSLSRIAARTQRAGVSLDQMLVSLYRANPQAFIGNNMNLLRSGVVLAVPAADAAKAVTTPEARQVIQAQSADFGAYRQRLASGLPTAKIEGSSRQASGKVQASVNDRQPGAAPAPDKLTLSKGGVTGKAAVEDSISKDRAKKADDVRVAELSKNLEDLKKLSGAASAAAPKTLPAPSPEAPVRAAPTAPTAPASTPTPVAVQAPAPTAAPAAPAVPAAPVSPAVVPASVLAASPPASASEPKPAPALTAPAASAPAAAKAPASPAPAKPVAAPADEPGVLGSLLGDNPTALGLGGLALALLAGFGIYRFSKRAKKDSGETSFLESRLQPDSFFGASGGQRIDTRDAGGASSSMSYSLSQLDAIGDVDPVAEADVYLAYGRDLQAEEILKEAMRSTPERMAIRTKLLEVYAKRRDTKGFELLATQLFALTRGEGEDWAKAQEMGAQIDPENPLFQPGGAPVLMQGAGGQVIEPLGASTMPQSILPTPSQFGTSVLPTEPGNLGLDLDLDLGDPDTGARSAAAPPDARYVATPVATGAGSVAKPAVADDSMSLDFSLPNLDERTQPSPSSGVEPKPFDLADISFDIDMPDTQPGAPAMTTAQAASGHSSGFGDIDLPPLDGDADPLSRKLELAEEFRQIGDTDGARDLLLEVVAKATGAVKTRAQNMLAALG
jgi:pilus assembly protein FimV